MDEFNDKRKASQPAGASMGSTFKNPPNDYAGRLIEAAGLKGKRVGEVEVSPRHANFFVNTGRGNSPGLLPAHPARTTKSSYRPPASSSNWRSNWSVILENKAIMANKLKLGVIFGGRSGEHEVSLLSARSVLAVLDPGKYEITQIGITHDGAWYTGTDLISWMEKPGRDLPPAATILPVPGHTGVFAIDSTDRGGKIELLTSLDVVFPVLHGSFGEDGTLQGLLEMAGIAYVGAGVLASSVAMDKALFKDVMRTHGIPVVDSVTVTRRQITGDMPDCDRSYRETGQLSPFRQTRQHGLIRRHHQVPQPL